MAVQAKNRELLFRWESCDPWPPRAPRLRMKKMFTSSPRRLGRRRTVVRVSKGFESDRLRLGSRGSVMKLFFHAEARSSRSATLADIGAAKRSSISWKRLAGRKCSVQSLNGRLFRRNSPLRVGRETPVHKTIRGEFGVKRQARQTAFTAQTVLSSAGRIVKCRAFPGAVSVITVTVTFVTYRNAVDSARRSGDTLVFDPE